MVERFGVKKIPGALHGYVSKRIPYVRALSQRDFSQELNGGNGYIEDDGLRFVEADPSDKLEFDIKRTAWDAAAASVK